MSPRGEREQEIRRPASAAELEAALAIRRQVFVDEQKIPAELEYDGKDREAVHVVALDGDRVVATARLLVTTGGEGVLARVAVLPEHRRRGLGRRLVEALEAEARSAGLVRVVLWPHAYLERFYEELGYRSVPGSETVVAGHPLIEMEKLLERGREG